MHALTELARRQHDAVSVRQLLALGIPSDEVRRRVRRDEWIRLRTGVIGLARPSTELGVLAQQAWAVLLVLPAGSVVCGPTAAALWRLERAVRTAADDLTHVLLPAGTRHHPLRGCALHKGMTGETASVFGVPCTGIARTCVEEAARLSLAEAVVLLDSALRSDPTLRGQLRIATTSMPARGRQRAGQALGLATGLTESPLESLAHVLWHEAGLPPPTLQATIRDGGRFVARVDFLWPGTRLVVEVDGLRKYGERGELQREKERQNQLLRLGYVVLRYTWADIVGRPEAVVRQVRAALGRAA